MTKASKSAFHLAFPVHDIPAARRFYVDQLGCESGRESASALILNLAGHQIVAHKVDAPEPRPATIYPRHFGLVFDSLKGWQDWLDHCRGRGVAFYQEPKLRHPGDFSEHHTFFLIDPSNNLLEFKHYTQAAAVFGADGSGKVGD